MTSGQKVIVAYLVVLALALLCVSALTDQLKDRLVAGLLLTACVAGCAAFITFIEKRGK